jgi:hypothetical protein
LKLDVRLTHNRNIFIEMPDVSWEDVAWMDLAEEEIHLAVFKR